MSDKGHANGNGVVSRENGSGEGNEYSFSNGNGNGINNKMSTIVSESREHSQEI